MNVACRVAMNNAVNTSIMAANNAARRARRSADENWVLTPGSTIALIFVTMAMLGLVAWLGWEVLEYVVA